MLVNSKMQSNCQYIIIHGINITQHDNNLTKLMIKAKEYGLVFNGEKCHIRVPSVS